MPLKKIKRAFKKVTKPIAKVLDKVVPNEIKPFLPYAAAFVPFAAPASFGIGSLSPMVSRAILAGGTNLAAQLAQEGSEGDFSGLSALLAAGTGALSTPGAADTLRGAQTVKGTPFADVALESADATLTSGGFFEGAKNVGLEGLAKTADFLNVAPDSGGIGDILRPGGTELTLKNIAKAGSIPFTQGSIDLGMATARKALRDYELELDAFNAQAGAAREASDADRRAAIIASMTRANFTQDIIDETLDQLGLKDGGRVGFEFGGITEAVKNVAKEPKKFLVDELEVTVQPGQSEKMAIVNAMFNDVDNVMPEDRKAEFYKLYLPQLKDSGEISQNDYNSLIKELNLIELDKDYKVTKDPKLIKFIDKLQPAAEGIDNLLKKVGIDVDKMRTGPNIRKAKGGLASLKDGGIMDLGGKEMDMRGGGFIPIGAKERADDVPARLSKNEFVMTADAVRAAGGGSVNKGAKRMYDLMHKLEARA